MVFGQTNKNGDGSQGIDHGEQGSKDIDEKVHSFSAKLQRLTQFYGA